MLLEFRIRNYRSIRDEIVLSFVASKDKKLADTHLASTDIKSLPQVIRSAVIYGPNASGKSKLLEGMQFMRAVVAESATSMKPSDKFNVQPFLLDTKFASQPTSFELSFVLGGVRHQYGFNLTRERIVDEWLLVYRSAKPQQWFSRSFDDVSQKYVYSFSTHLSGPRKLWEETTRSNALFLSTAAQLNSELLGPIFLWLVDRPLFLGVGLTPPTDFTTQLLKTEEGKRDVLEFLTSADVSISDVVSESRQALQQQVKFGGSDGPILTSQELQVDVPQFIHETENGSAIFGLDDESRGTKHLYNLVAPVLDVLKHGRMLIVDELDSSLHPLLVRWLVNLFHKPERNPLGAQLLFTTHDTSLLDNTLFRRDQIWFIEKDRDQATHLYPFSDFNPRKAEAWEKGYLTGRYGALPFFNDFVPPLQVAG